MNCWDYMTEEEKDYVKEYGCFACSDCAIPYRRIIMKKNWIKLAHLIIDLWVLIEKIIKSFKKKS